MAKPDTVLARYLARRPLPGPWALAGNGAAGFAGAVVIPALAESGELFATLDSLAANPQPWPQRFLCVVVVNQGAATPVEQRDDNRRTLQRLAQYAAASSLPLAWVDACAPGRELPPGDGVGLARKIGCDLALPRLDWTARPLLLNLDADTRVDTNYLPAIASHFAAASAGAAVLPYCHRPAAHAAAQAAIDRYELYLRHDLLGLTLAGSPYAYTSLGSAIACRAASYLAADGMNRRRAGEDFYFLQQLAKVDGVAPLGGTTVHPSPRCSSRTPFGTGPSVARLLDAPLPLPFLPWSAFAVLRAWLQLVDDSLAAPAPALLAAAQHLAPELAALLAEKNFVAVWSRLQRQQREPALLRRAFHGWFDALATRRLLRRLAPLPLPPAATVPQLLARAGLPPGGGEQDWLAVLRTAQGVTVPPAVPLR